MSFDDENSELHRELELSERVRHVVSTIARLSDKALVSSDPDSVRLLVEEVFDKDSFGRMREAFLVRFMPERPNAADWAKWLHGGEQNSPFDRIPRPVGRPTNERRRPVVQAVSSLAKLREKEIEGLTEISYLESRIADEKAKIAKVRAEIDAEDSFVKASTFYIMMEGLARSGSKALSMGPLLTVAEAIYEHYGYDVMALVLREMVGNTEFKHELAERIHDLCLTHFETAEDMLKARVAAGSAEAAVPGDASDYDADTFEELFSGRRAPKV